MTKQHSLTPPPELIQELAKSAGYKISPGWLTYALEKVFQAGADQELEACCEWLRSNSLFAGDVEKLRAARRPKPPSLKEQALSELNLTADSDGAELSLSQVKLICKALEQLND
jgi:hypothetical protein